MTKTENKKTREQERPGRLNPCLRNLSSRRCQGRNIRKHSLTNERATWSPNAVKQGCSVNELRCQGYETLAEEFGKIYNSWKLKLKASQRLAEIRPESHGLENRITGREPR